VSPAAIAQFFPGIASVVLLMMIMRSLSSAQKAEQRRQQVKKRTRHCPGKARNHCATKHDSMTIQFDSLDVIFEKRSRVQGQDDVSRACVSEREAAAVCFFVCRQQ
jgi:hypothetical protein